MPRNARVGGDSRQVAVRKSRKPGRLQARMAMAAFVVVAAATLSLTSAGIIYALTPATVAGQIASANVPMIEAIR